MTLLQQMGQRAQKAAQFLRTVSSKQKNDALLAIANHLEENEAEILLANAQDRKNFCERLAADPQANPNSALLDRLTLTRERIQDIARSVRDVAALPDPVGKVLGGQTLPNGLEMRRISVPLGAVGMIYEARPNVTVDAAVLCLKSSNACILRGGKEALHSASALEKIMRGALESAGFPADCVQLVKDTSRESALEMMKLNGYLDVLIPRGGAGLIRSVVENATVPVIETGVGNCHVYVDASADLETACRIVDNAKTSRPSVCNAIENVLVHRDIAKAFLPPMKEALDRHQVQLRGCPETIRILGDDVTEASPEDYDTEFLDYILAVKVVGSVEDAIDHINLHGTRHSECIVTNDYGNSRKFTLGVDAAAVYVNASTRFTDGGEFGLGAEIGISTQKLHARGPMGLEELTSYKYILEGNGQIR